MLSDVGEWILEFLFHILIEVVCFYTGEIVLYLLTFGRKKPRWDYYTEASPVKFMIMTEISVWMGLAFWILAIVFISRAIMD